jgi:hypothetical protein
MPGVPEIIAVGVESGDRFGTKLESAPDYLQLWNMLLEFCRCRLAEPAEWSYVVGEYFENHIGIIGQPSTGWNRKTAAVTCVCGKE